MNLCIIPARGGSKRIPRKNIRNFCGKPMIAWSIQAAQLSGCFDKIIVSTDDQEIAKIADSYGALIPFIRPSSLSGDFTTTQEVVAHAICQMEVMGEYFNNVCCLYATSPFVLPVDLINSLELLKQSRSGTVVFAATSFPFPIERAIKIDENGYSRALNPLSSQKRSQDLESCFHDAGQFCWASPETWSSNINFFDCGRPLVLPRWRVQDIDTEEDWQMAEILHQLSEKN